MAEKKRQLTTRRMPSGGQQYTRQGRVTALRGGDTPPQRRMNMVEDIIDRHPEMRRELHRAFMDEADLSRAATQNQMQALEETNSRRRSGNRYESGGMVRGTRSVQMSGKGFRGSY